MDLVDIQGTSWAAGVGLEVGHREEVAEGVVVGVAVLEEVLNQVRPGPDLP